MKPEHYVVQFSGGVGSWAAAKRIAQEHGTKNLTLLFADTLIEDPDLYRFLDDAVKNIGGNFVRIADGRTPWELFKDKRFLGNSMVDTCSRILKRELLNNWIEENCDQDYTTIVLGIDWSEAHRLYRVQDALDPWRVIAPMCDEPCMLKVEMIAWLEAEGIEPPSLYKDGFPHNNCGGMCVKAGFGQFKLLLKMRPETYAKAEAEEESLRQYLGKNVTILRSRAGKQITPITLREFRERIEKEDTAKLDLTEWGGCGCALP